VAVGSCVLQKRQAMNDYCTCLVVNVAYVFFVFFLTTL
jgi:hypothetical protein